MTEKNPLKLNKLEQAMVDDLKTDLLKKLKDEVVLIRLFGSKARGDYHKHSDIDLLVILRHKDRKTNERLSEVEWEILEKYNFQSYISVAAYSQKEFDGFCRLQTPFAQNVAKEGISLWDISRKTKAA
ncbi:MAG: nucleotidyltransferase domain-containing protein [bacterium]|nr:nucleotidyltransferase domain-containing protein [bacterium]